MSTAGHFDVAIVGGRIAGASLGIRLASAGFRVVVIERARFPSAPATSVPLLMNTAMALLDELGLEETEYASGSPRLGSIMFEMSDHFATELQIPDVGGRAYIYGMDRERLDSALWERLGQTDGVDARANTRARGLLFDDHGRVVGVSVSEGTEAPYPIHASVVVGADGRRSLVAKEVEAPVIHRREDCDTTLHYAYWEGCSTYGDDGRDVVHIHAGCDGFSFILMPSRDGRTGVVTQGRSDRYQMDGGADATYRRLLEERPAVGRRLREATKVTPLSGVKGFGNLFRKASGPGWVLVGDALHQKDSYDAQGIYDALVAAKQLAEELGACLRGDVTTEEAMARYERRVTDELRPMFDATMERVKREMYSDPPAFIAKTIIRWTMTDPVWQERFMSLMTRQISPRGWAPPSVQIGAIARGILRDLRPSKTS